MTVKTSFEWSFLKAELLYFSTIFQGTEEDRDSCPWESTLHSLCLLNAPRQAHIFFLKNSKLFILDEGYTYEHVQTLKSD